MKYITTILFLIVTNLVISQNIYYYKSTNQVQETEIRSIMGALSTYDSDVHHSDDRKVLAISSRSDLPESFFRSIILDLGISLENNPNLSEYFGDTNFQRPIYILTGDPENDRQRYYDSVNSWNLENPDDIITPHNEQN